MQQAILTGQLPPGTKLPSSRTLAEDLGIARNTVLHVYDQLTAEGYVISTTGSGTYVADTRPDTAAVNARRKPAVAGVDAQGQAQPGKSRSRPNATWATCPTRGRRLIDKAGVSAKQWGAFMPGVPDVAEFPARTWSRLQARLWKEANPDLLTYAPGGGYRPLRRALSDYLRVARSVNCTPDQIIITTGIHQSIDLAVRLLTDVGDRAWVEEPCYWGARSVLQSSGITLVPVPVDDEGLNPREQDLQQPPRLALVTPSHQYPLGMVMSLARRRTLLEYARQHNVWIIEDDYDSEFRYGSRPLASLQGLDDAGQVIYVGSLGKMLFPGLADRLHDRAGASGGYVPHRRRGAVSRRAVDAAGGDDRLHHGRASHVARSAHAGAIRRAQADSDRRDHRALRQRTAGDGRRGRPASGARPARSRERSRGDGRRLRRRRDRAAARELLQQRPAARGADCCSAMRAWRTTRSVPRSTRSRA